MKYVIFDFGQVLVHFEPSYMTKQYVADPADAAQVAHVVFDRLYWDRLDAGTVSDAEVVEAIKARLPERLGQVAAQVYDNWIYNIPEVEGMCALILHLKQDLGVKVFVLSNISTYFAVHAHEIPILSLADGCVFSAVCGMTKPNADIFEHICRKFGLEPSWAVFVDDREENACAARRLGMQAYVFEGDVAVLRQYLDRVCGQDAP